MLRVQMSEARPGMVLAQDIVHPKVPGGRLLRAGAKLDAPCLARLAAMGVHEVTIKYPGLEELAQFSNPRVLQSAQAVTRELAVVLDSAAVESKVELDYWSYRKAVMGLLEAFAERPGAAHFASIISRGERPLVEHSGSVCMLGLLMALKLEFYLVHERSRLPAQQARDVGPLGVGAMLHDIGMTRLADEPARRWAQRHDESDPEWQAHARLGFEMVCDQVDPAAAGVVLQHHQYYDGSGFPARTDLNGATRVVAGSDIHVFARIVSCAELFTRARAAPGGQAAPVVRALRTILHGPWRARIDPIVLRALVTVTPPFPPGTLVTLSDGRSAAVMAYSPASPCRPVVQIVDPAAAQSARREPKPERIDLSRTRDLTVVRAEGHDVAADLFDPASPDEFDLTRVGTAMVNRAAALDASARSGPAAA